MIYCYREQTLTTAAASCCRLCNAKELEVLCLESWDSVANTLSKNSLEAGTVRGVRVSGRKIALTDIGDWRRWVIEDGRPLLDLLEEVLRVKSGIPIYMLL